MDMTYLVTTLLIVATPGTGVMITLAAGLSRGSKAAIVAALGCTLGIIPHMLVAISGLAGLLYTHPRLFDALRYLGMLYMLRMAWLAWKHAGSLGVDAATEAPAGFGQVIWQAVLANLLNPKLSIFFIAFLPQFIQPHSPSPLLEMVNLSLGFMLITLVVFVMYGLGAASISQHIRKQPAIIIWMHRGFAAAFVGLGLKLVWTPR